MDERSQHQMSLKPPRTDERIGKTLGSPFNGASLGSSEQGLRLGRAFASIKDPAVREAIVDLVEAMSKRST